MKNVSFQKKFGNLKIEGLFVNVYFLEWKSTLNRLVSKLRRENRLYRNRAAYQKTPQEKRKIRLEFQNTQSSPPNSQYQIAFNQAEINLVKSREVFWMISGHGPFRSYFLNPIEDRTCRLCSEGEETPTHLLNECNAVSQTDLSDVRQFEKLAVEIVSKLYRFRE